MAGSDHNSFFPESITDWTEFYNSVGVPAKTGIFEGQNGPGKPVSFDSLKAFLNKPRGERDVVLPNGDSIGASGSPALDFMRGVLGVSPLDNTAEDTKGEPVAPGTGSAFDLAGSFTQIALIAIGAVVIFVALWMLLSSQGITPKLELPK
jgi:hypothetical protein